MNLFNILVSLVASMVSAAIVFASIAGSGIDATVSIYFLIVAFIFPFIYSNCGQPAEKSSDF